jgi:Putative Actinobacterial Holin-X, holin superfamily III
MAARQEPESTGTTQTDRLEDRPLPQLMQQVAQDLRDLVRQEMTLARIEIEREVRVALRGGSSVAAGGLVGGLAGFLAAEGIAELTGRALSRPGGYLAVSAGLGAVSAALIVRGLGRLKTVDPVPRQTLEAIRGETR